MNVKHFPSKDEEFNKAYEELMEISRTSDKKDYSDIQNPRNTGRACYYITEISSFMRRVGGSHTMLKMSNGRLLVFCSLLLDCIYFNSLCKHYIETEFADRLMMNIKD